LGLGFRLGLGLRLFGGLALRLGLAAVAVPGAGQQRLDQLLAAQPAVALDPELRRDRAEVGERALLELFAVQDGHEAGEDVTRLGGRSPARRAASRGRARGPRPAAPPPPRELGPPPSARGGTPARPPSRRRRPGTTCAWARRGCGPRPGPHHARRMPPPAPAPG